MKKLILFTFAHLLIISSLIAQSNIWSLPPNYIFNDGVFPVTIPLPQGVGFGAYAGQVAQYNHNAMQDANGDLLFFIVDSEVYDKNGETLGSLTFGASTDFLIVPAPGNCQRFFFIGDETHPQTDQIPNPPILFSSYVGVNEIDFSLSTPGVVNGGCGNVIDQFNFSSYVSSIIGFHHYAASKLRTDNSRFVFVNIYDKLITLKIDANIPASNCPAVISSQPLNFIPNAPVSRIRTEMEVVEYFNTSANQLRYKVALVHDGPTLTQQSIYYVELDYTTGLIIPGTEKNYTNYPVGTEIKGLEFSPNTDYLYISHTGGNYIDYMDVTTTSTTLNPIALPSAVNKIDFQYGQLELAADGKIYIAGKDNVLNFGYRLATIGSPNTPTAPLWNDNALPTTYVSNTALYTHPFHKSYILPDQIDGMNYSTIYTIDENCCAETVDFEVYSVDNTHEYNASATWELTGAAGTNPWNTNGTVFIRDKMIIKTGSNITIKGMTLKFASKGQLIIENGARLTLDNTTLTVDTRCNPEAMWHGVEIWGNGTFQPVTSGFLFSKNNSTIEHAIEATANYKHNLNGIGNPILGSAVAGTTGGIISLKSTTLHNNMFDVYMRPFQSALPNGSTINDASSFKDCNFVTDGLLNDQGVVPLEHVRLLAVSGVQFMVVNFKIQHQ